MPIESGKRYVFINKQSGTALDLDTGDNRSVQGWTRHGFANQQWEAIRQQGDNWQFKNVAQGSNLGREGNDDGARIVCVNGVHNWMVDQQHGTGENVYRLVAAGTPKCVDLADGNGQDGTPVQMWTSIFAKANQTWEAQQVDDFGGFPSRPATPV